MDFPEFRNTLIKARKELLITGVGLSAELGLSLSVVSMWETGARIPSEANARRWAEALEVPFPADTDGWFSRKTWNRGSPCGTRTGYDRHRRDGEDACRPCKQAASAYQAKYKQRFIA